ncbi:MAG: hypothetical protein R6X19_02225 [Kiritimatiellia bacterium]
MKHRLLALLAAALLPFAAPALEIAPEPLDALSLDGALENENATFTLSFNLKAGEKTELPVVAGPVAFLKAKLPPGATIRPQGDAFVLEMPARFGWFRSDRTVPVEITFAARVTAKPDGWNEAAFRLPPSTLRRIRVTAEKAETDVEFPGGRLIERLPAGDRLEATAFLAPAPETVVRWKPQLRKQDGELVATCEANVLAATAVGGLRLDTLFTYRVSQGALRKIEIRVPDSLNITEVNGAEIQEWKIAPAADGARLLTVILRRPWETAYRLQVIGDRPLSDMPCRFDLPVLQPLGVMRASGFLMAGADTAVKLSLRHTAGLTQIDQTAFPTASLDAPAAPRAKPQRNAFAWQYANLPYTLSLEAEDIVSEYTSDDRLVLSVEDRDLVLNASTEIEFRDAPSREVVLETDPAWSVAAVTGSQLADYDVRDAGGLRHIRLTFKSAQLGRALFELRLERSLAAGEESFAVPRLRLAGAKNQRGYVAASAETGLRLKQARIAGLRDVHVGSLPFRLPDLQLAYRYRDADWSAELAVERTKPALYAEVFNLCSIGEGVLYGSASISCHISGAPARSLKLKIPQRLQNIEFTGRDIRNWSHSGDVWTVTLQEKVIGAHTLLVTFDQRLDYAAADFDAGGLSVLDAEGEVGYLVIAGDGNLAVAEKTLSPGLLRIDREEIPTAYALLVNMPVAAAYKYVGAPPDAAFAFTRYDTERMIDQVVDHTTLETRLGRDGEAVTKAVYFIKNASQQYLAVALPAGAKLWKVQTGTDEKSMKEVTALKGETATLIPIGRLRDPNTPLRVELAYASAVAPLGRLGGTVLLEAPGVRETQSTFARWTVMAPEGRVLKVTGGSLPADRSPDAALWQVLRNVAILWLAPVLAQPAVGTVGLALLAALALILFARGRGRGVGIAVLLSLVLLVIGLLAGGVLSQILRLPEPFALRHVSWSGGETAVSASRVLNLEDGKPALLALDVSPKSLGAGFPRLLLLATLALGIALAAISLLRGKRGPLLIAALILMAVGLSALATGRALLTVALAAGPPLLLAWAFLAGAWRAGQRRRAVTEEPPSAPPALPADAGAVTLRGIFLALTVGASLLAGLLRAEDKAPAPPPPPDLVLENVALTLQAPLLNRHSEPAIPVQAVFTVKADKPGAFLAAGPDAVLTEVPIPSRDYKVERQERGTVVTISNKGTYEIRLAYVLPALVEGPAADFWGVRLFHPAARTAEAELRIPAIPVDVTFTEGAARHTVREEAGATVVVVNPTAQPVCEIRWKPRARKTQLEETLFFAEVLTYAAFEPGVVELSALCALQIAQGQVQSVAFDIPAGMSVTAVTAPGLSTWRYDSDSRQLEALFEKPVSGSLNVALTLQVPREGLPYEAALSAPVVRGAARQRGAFALAVPDTVQLAVSRTTGVSAMAIEDFPAPATPAPRIGAAARTLKRAYRYQQPPASLAVTAEKVVPEIKAVEKAALSIGDERIVLSSQLDVSVARAGIFSLAIGIPAGYDVETLTGQEVSHWDEVKEGANRAVVVHFQRQVLDTRRLNVVISRLEKGIEKTILLPRLDVREAVKHGGTLTVSGERGVRLSTESRDGAVEVNPRELGLADAKVLAYSLLRPGWSVTLSAEVLAPTLKPELLHSVDLAEGVMRETAMIRYAIENAGCKIFRLQAPRPGAALTITGRGVSKAFEADREKGIWQVELANKAEQTLLLKATCQSPFDPAARQVTVLPFRTLDTENQRGYVTVTASGRMQVKPAGEPAGLKPEDARGMPADFGAGDLSDAILCYRAVSPDYSLAIDVRRHGSETVLPARVRSLKLTSVLAGNNQMLTRAEMDLDAGDLRFLTLTLPEKTDRLWSVFVNGKVGRASRDGRAYRIPLESSLEGEATALDIQYAGVVPAAGSLSAPRFDLPLNNVTWSVYLRPGRLYYGIGGDFTLAEREQGPVVFDQSSYSMKNRLLLANDLSRAKSVMAKGESLIRKGSQKEARQALEAAMNYSSGQADMNEDARIQYNTLIRNQAVMGLAQRGLEMRQERQTDQEAAAPAQQQADGFNAGNFTPEYQRQIEQTLSADESANLYAVADKIIGQQRAAVAVARAIRVTLPEQGVKIEVTRPIVIHPNAELRLTWRSLPEAPWRKAGSLVLVLAALAVCMVVRKKK